MAYYGLVCQGDTPSASDCFEVYKELKAKYGSANVRVKGFDTTSGEKTSDIAGVDEYRWCRNGHVLYWSGHGGYASNNVLPELNVTVSSKTFGSGVEAMNYWPQSPCRLNVVILASCYQFYGSNHWKAWANNVMRRTDIRVMCGYHNSAPSSTDADIAKKFFALCKEGSTGNSVMYSWRNANIAYDRGGYYTVLVYNDDNRCYYRLPGFSSKTYADPDPASTSIYRYYSTNSSMEIAKPASVSQVALQGTVPYELNIANGSALTLKDQSLSHASKLAVDTDRPATFYLFRENDRVAMESKMARKANMECINSILDGAVLDQAAILTFDDAMAEIPVEGEVGPEMIIGAGTRVMQQYNGILLDGNTIAVSSDANGVYNVMNHWTETTTVKSVDHIDLAHNDTKYLAKCLSINPVQNNSETSIKTARPIYKKVGNKYVLHYEIEHDNGSTDTVDAKVLAK